MKKILLLIALSLSLGYSLYSQKYQILRQFDVDYLGFNPTGTPIVVDSFYYGMTRTGGAHSFGTIYRMKPDGSNYKVIHSFDRFNGSQPSASLLNAGDWLYGMTYKSGVNDEGVIFKIKKDGTEKSVIHSFSGDSNDAAGPSGSLIMVDSVLFGMSQHGGKYNKGAIFKIKPDGSDFALLYSFDYMKDSGSVPHGDLVYHDGILYGIAQHIVFSINTDGTNFKIIKVFTYSRTDGYMMLGNPSVQESVIYGTTEQLDSIYGGSVFRVNVDGTGFQTIHRFPKYDSTDGFRPTGHLLIKDNKIYGMTSSGGQFGVGTIFMMNPDGTNYRILYNFGTVTNDGRGPGDYDGLNYYKGSLAGVLTWGGNKNGIFFRLGDMAVQDSCAGFFSYPEFLNAQDIKTNGYASIYGDILRLCPRISDDSGSVFHTIPVPIASNFKTEFTFSFSQGKNDYNDGSPDGADGIAFVIQANDIRQIGQSGGGIGYSGISNSFAIEFDDYNNGDDYGENNGSHLAVFSNGRVANSSNHHSYAKLGYTENIPLLQADSTVYYGKIEYRYDEKKLKIWLDKTGDFSSPALEIDSIDIPSMLNLIDNNKAYIGFTAATGGSVQNTDLLTWSWCFNNEQKVMDVQVPSESGNIISPNPATDFIEITSGDVILSEAKDLGVMVYNVLGVEVLNNSQLLIFKSQLRIDVSHLSPGLYFVRVGDKVRKFVKI